MNRVLLISSVQPRDTSGGELVLHRHLCRPSNWEFELYGTEPEQFRIGILDRRLAGRLNQTRLRRWAQDYLLLRDGRWLDKELRHTRLSRRQTIVMTVAHGDACGAAVRFARRHHLPLVTVFHDWWPDIPDVHPFVREILRKRFQRTYSESRVAWCVSDGMRAALGSHPHVDVLYPVPPLHPRACPKLSNVSSSQKSAFKILYAGNLGEYGPMLQNALQSSKDHPSLRLEVRGTNPNWPQSFRTEMRQRGLWFEFVPRCDLDSWLASADAFLIPMVFDANMRRRMQTSFPSKLTEFVQFGKPLVIWGPDYCSAVQWARRGERAVCAVDEGAPKLLAILEDLRKSPAEQRRLSKEATSAAINEFDPIDIQKRFLSGLDEAVKQIGDNYA
jgi:glycosyltransferase involved in cell wall biosynthesis